MLIISSSLVQYKTSDIKRALDTKITEFSSDGLYDYLPFPSYDFQSPSEDGPFWKRDVLLIKWGYSEPLNNLIPFSNIYLVSSSEQTLIEENVETNIKNINWSLPSWMILNMPYHLKISSIFEGEEIFDTSSVFTIDERSINILTNPPVNPIVANEGNTWEFEWNGHGTSDNVKIELLRGIEANTIIIEDTLGRLMGNIEEGDPIVPSNNPPLNGDPSNPAVIAVLEPNKYVDGNTSYTWTVDDIPFDVDSVRLKVIDSFNSFVYGYTENIELEVPFLDVRNLIGRRLGDIIIPEVSMSGDGEASLSVYGFNPPAREVLSGESFTFNYDTTNAVQVYLTKDSRPNESIVFPTLDGIYTINNIEMDDIYTVNAADVNNGLRMATFNVDVVMEPGSNGEDIKEFTLLELTNHCISLGEEALISGDAIIEPGAPILSKVPFYRTEVSQMDESTSYDIVKYLLTLVNEDILVVLWNGQEEPPRIRLGAGDLRDRIVLANTEVSNRFEGIDPVAGFEISGIMLSDSMGIPEININFNNGGGNTETDIAGRYTQLVPAFYSGVATPDNTLYNFVPVNIVYTQLQNNMTNQDYEGTLIPAPVVVIITTPLVLPNGRNDKPYLPPAGETFQLQAIGGSGTYTWSINPQTPLPTGMVLLENGIILGTPTVNGTKTMIIEVTDGTYQDSRNFTIKILPQRGP